MPIAFWVAFLQHRNASTNAPGAYKHTNIQRRGSGGRGMLMIIMLMVAVMMMMVMVMMMMAMFLAT